MKATLVLVVFSIMSGANPTPGTSSYERPRAYAEKSFDSLAACQQELPPLFRDARLYYMNEPADAGQGGDAPDMRPAAHLLAIDSNFRISVDCYEGSPKLETIDLASIASAARQAAAAIVLSRCEASGCTSVVPARR